MATTAAGRAPRGYAFALRPAWITGHVLVLVAVVVLVNLGLWQLRRLDERREDNALVLTRSVAAPVAVEDLADEPVADVEFRRVTATGTFDAAHEVFVGYRSSRGLPGYHVVTPLVLDGPSGRAVLVNRGFVPLDIAERWATAGGRPPGGVVTITGLLRRSFDARSDAIAGSATAERPPVLDDVDVGVIDAYVAGDLLPVFVELQQPRPDGFPEPLPPLDLGEGPHLSYAVQWFLFAAVAGIGWAIVLRRRARAVNPRTHHSVHTP